VGRERRLTSDIKEEPRTRRAKRNLSVLPLTLVVAEIAERSLGDLKGRSGLDHSSEATDLIWWPLLWPCVYAFTSSVVSQHHERPRNYSVEFRGW
jgi:hypothetical protein